MFSVRFELNFMFLKWISGISCFINVSLVSLLRRLQDITERGSPYLSVLLWGHSAVFCINRFVQLTGSCLKSNFVRAVTEIA